MTALVKILYEDQQAADVKEFALHVLVRRCVLDRLGWPEERMEVVKQAIVGSPKKGDKNLLRACEDAREWRNARHLVAVFDDDKVRRIERLGLSGSSACKQAVRRAITQQCPHPHRLRVVLLGRNMESVVSAVQRCKGVPESGKLPLLMRDSLLASIAWRPDFAAIRACVLAEVPSLEYLIARLSTMLAEHRGP